MKRFNVQGSWPALVTPLDENGNVNLEVLKRLLDFHVEFGSNGVLLLGSTGEPILLTRDERRRIVEASVDHANGRIPIMCGVSAPSTRETIENARHARDAGVDCGLMVQPPYVKPSQAAIYKYFKDVADEVDLPLVIYNNPDRCVVNVEPETVARLAQHPNFVAIKEAGPSPYAELRVIELTKGEFNVLSCDCPFYAHIPVVMASGGKGTSNVTGSICPTEFAEMSKPWENYDDVLRTRKHLFRLLPLIRMMYSESNPVPLKSALNMLGAKVGRPRLPLTELAEANVATLRQTMERLGILSEDSYQQSFFNKK
ncbi:MAG: 4-hydroxy-tetrahydrodipicolinate synthase [Candidatus Bathyarchaeota archaeon]|nr:4-hydroxy-tetrahydrodipicolinate synthase [Candidatus Bathyarchaeota archaeon]